MGSFILFIIIATVVIAFITAVSKEAGSKSRGGDAKSNMEALIRRENIQDYEWQLFRDGQILLNNCDAGMIYVIEHDGHISRYYENITDVQLVIDDEVEYKASLSSAAGRAAVGGLLLGGVGAIIGGVTGKKNGKTMVNKIELILSYKDSGTHYSKITVLDERGGVGMDSVTYEDAYARGMHWSKMISGLTN